MHIIITHNNYLIMFCFQFLIYNLFLIFIHVYFERGEGREKKEEKHQSTMDT